MKAKKRIWHPKCCNWAVQWMSIEEGLARILVYVDLGAILIRYFVGIKNNSLYLLCQYEGAL